VLVVTHLLIVHPKISYDRFATMSNNNYPLPQKSIVRLGVMCLFTVIALHNIRASHPHRQLTSEDLIQAPSFNDQKNVEGMTSKSQLALPSILFLGAQKAGSSSVSSWLFQGGVCRPKTFPGEPTYYAKEVHFFDKDDRLNQGVEFYAQRFQHCVDEGNDLMMDATPDYLTYPEQISDVYNNAGADALSKLKLIVILREPISRELSWYNHKYFYAHGSGPTFERHSELVLKGIPDTHWTSLGRYVDHLKKFASFVNRDSILVLSYDELKNDPEKVQWRIQQFLGREFPGKLATINTHDDPNKLKEVSASARQMLEPYFGGKNEELFEFLDTHSGPPMEQRPFPRFDVE